MKTNLLLGFVGGFLASCASNDKPPRRRVIHGLRRSIFHPLSIRV